MNTCIPHTTRNRLLIGLLMSAISIISAEASAGTKIYESSGVFTPSEHSNISYQDAEYSMAVSISSYNATLSIVPPSIDSYAVKLPESMAQINSITRYKNKVILTGMATGLVYVVAIVDLLKKELYDSFLAYAPEISPNNRYISFIRFYPAHGSEGPEDQYRLYDVEQIASENRALARSDFFAADNVGRSLLGTSQTDLLGPNTGIPAATAHHMASSNFFWAPDSKRVLFADHQGEVFKIITAYVDADGLASKEQTVNVGLCVPSCYPMLMDSVEFNLEATTAKVRSLNNYDVMKDIKVVE